MGFQAKPPGVSPKRKNPSLVYYAKSFREVCGMGKGGISLTGVIWGNGARRVEHVSIAMDTGIKQVEWVCGVLAP